jgi:8-amino-7-oxononanoate synthase
MGEQQGPSLPFSSELEDELGQLRRESLLRSNRAEAPGLVSFASNDYLGLRRDPRLSQAACAAIADLGAGSGSSRLIGGSHPAVELLERELARFKGYEAALVFPTGYQTAVGTIAALVGPDDDVYLDKLNHASLIDGARLSRARMRVYPHASIRKLKRLLERAPRGRRLIVTDGLFSMDGDLAPLEELTELAARYGAGLMVDEAHATGCLGAGGRGAAELLGVQQSVALSMGTLSKALGSLGGFLCASRSTIDFLVNRARSFIYTTAAAPGQAAAARAALRVVIDEPERRQRLAARAALLRELLAGAGFDTGGSVSQIVPVILGENRLAMAASGHLRESGYHCPAVRYPTVPRNGARLRLSLSSEHTEEQVRGVVDALVSWRRQGG